MNKKRILAYKKFKEREELYREKQNIKRTIMNRELLELPYRRFVHNGIYVSVSDMNIKGSSPC